MTVNTAVLLLVKEKCYLPGMCQKWHYSYFPSGLTEPPSMRDDGTMWVLVDNPANPIFLPSDIYEKYGNHIIAELGFSLTLIRYSFDFYIFMYQKTLLLSTPFSSKFYSGVSERSRDLGYYAPLWFQSQELHWDCNKNCCKN